MRTLSDAPDQPLQEAKAKLRNLLTEYVATDLQHTIRSGFGDTQNQLETGIIRIKGEAEELQKKVRQVWEDRWEAWEERLDKLPAALREQFIAELSGPLAQQRELLQANAERLTGQMNDLAQNLSNQSAQQQQEMQARSAEFAAMLQQQEQRAAEHADAFFARLAGEMETTRRDTTTLHDTLTEQAQKLTADLQDFRQNSETALQASLDQMNQRLAKQMAQQQQEMQARSAAFATQLQQQEQRAAEHADAFFLRLAGEMETIRRDTTTLHDTLSEQANKMTADLQEFRENSERSIQALPVQMSAIATATQANQAGQISHLANQVGQLDQHGRKTNTLVWICLAVNAVTLLALLAYLNN